MIYEDVIVDKDSWIRTFDQNIDEHELKWHRDREDRIVESIGDTNWMFQRENSLPELLDKPIHIKAGEWHRVIKGDGTFTIKISTFTTIKNP